MFYNYARFGNLLEFGYRYHIPWLVETRQFLRQKGTWSLTYIPTNLYYLFLKGPDGVFIKGTHYLTFPFLTPDPWGMSIFLTSPLLLWSFAAPIKERIVQWCWITSISILLFLLGYFSTGALQFGYRYALDFSPFLFILLCYAFKKRMSILSKIVIALSFMVNIVFLTTAYSLL